MGLCLIYAVVLAWLMAFSSSLPYSYSDADYLAVLYVDGVFHLNDEFNPLVPYSQIHVPAVVMVWLVQLAGPLSGLVLWAAQTAAGCLLMYRIYTMTKWMAPNCTLAIVVLVVTHPSVWAVLLFAPTQTVTAWLAFEAISQVVTIREKRFRPELTMPIVLVLSLCEGNGYFWALAIGVFGAVRLVQTNQVVVGVSLLAPLAPATLMYAVLTLAWGTWGGPHVLNSPGLCQNVGLTPLMNGSWTTNVQSIGLWLGQGSLSLPLPLFLYGALALLGAMASQDRYQPFCYFAFAAVIIHGLLGAFSPVSEYEPLAFISLLFTITLCGFGIVWLAQQLRADWLTYCLVGTLALLSLVSSYFVLQPYWEQARFRQSLTQTIIQTVDEQGGGAALQFSPSVFVNLPSDEDIKPFGMRWKVSFNRSQIAFPPTSIGGLTHSAYSWIGFYQPFDDAQPGVLASSQGPLLDRIKSHYQIKREGNLEYWVSISDINASVSNAKPVGPRWDFEQGYSNTRQVGAAFGLEPDTSQSAVGVSSAGPGDGAEHMIGTIESGPFIIEGDELRFYADVPESSTQTFFALAVYSEAPWGENAKVQSAHHLFDHTPGKVLMGDEFVYIQPSDLAYTDTAISGWQVVRVLQGGDAHGWSEFRWAVHPWAGKQAKWLAADRDRGAAFRIDHIQQWKRAPGRYWNFEDGAYAAWQLEGDAFGGAPVIAPLGAQTPIVGFEGNYFVNSFYNGSDAAIGSMASETFVIDAHQLSVLVGGGNDVHTVFVGLEVEGEIVLRASGERDETLRRVVLDITPWMGKSARVVIVDQSAASWGHILVDDIRMVSVRP